MITEGVTFLPVVTLASQVNICYHIQQLHAKFCMKTPSENSALIVSGFSLNYQRFFHQYRHIKTVSTHRGKQTDIHHFKLGLL